MLQLKNSWLSSRDVSLFACLLHPSTPCVLRYWFAFCLIVYVYKLIEHDLAGFEQVEQVGPTSKTVFRVARADAPTQHCFTMHNS